MLQIIRRTLIIELLFMLCFLPLLAFAQAAPYANTLSPTSVTEKSARLNGRGNPSGMSDTLQWFEWGISGHPEVYNTAHSSMWAGNVLVDTSADIIGLAPNTQYFYRQIVENGRGKDIGSTVIFTTKPLETGNTPVILVETGNATSINEGGAILNGYVSPYGDTTSKSWFEWGKTVDLGGQTAASYVGGNSTPTQFTLAGLEPGTPYYFRLVGESSSGRSNGATKVFTTLGIKAVSPITTPTITIPTVTATGSTQTPATQTSSTYVSTTSECINLTVNLSKNSRASSVRTLQEFLVEKGFLKTQPTGYFGSATVFAVKGYQKSKGIIQTGAVFTQTRRAIRNETCG